MSTILYILIGILIFGLLIGIHEWGHFLAARACGVTVLEFSLGMGPAIVSKTSKKGTKISLRCLPIGGFCAMEGELTASEDPHAFLNAARWKRVLILVAGVTMNFLLGFLLIVFCFSDGEGFNTPMITSFMDGCPYESTDGLQVGDVFLRVNGKRIYFSSDIAEYLPLSEDGTVDIVLRRDGKRIKLENYPMTKQEYTDEETGETVLMYGLHFGVKETGFFATLKYSWRCALDFVRTIWQSLEDLVTGAVGLNQLSGVVGIVDVIAETGEASVSVMDAVLNLAYLTAFLAINLAVMNLLPFPALDGGRIFYLLVAGILETILRRKIDPKYEAAINAVGMILLISLMAYAMYNDISRLVTG